MRPKPLLSAVLFVLAVPAAAGDEPRLTLVRPVRLVAVERYSSYYVDLDASGADRRADRAFEAFASGMVNALGSRVVVPRSGSSESLSVEKGALFVRAQISRAEMSVLELAQYSAGRRRNFVLTTTGGIEVLDLVSGEVYESRLFTVYSLKDKIGELNAQDRAAIGQLFRENVRELFAELGKQLAAGYSPGSMKAVVVDRLGPSRVAIDRGSEACLSLGETFRHGRAVYRIKQLFDQFAILEAEGASGSADSALTVGTEVSRNGFNTLGCGQTSFMVLDASVVKSPLIAEPNGIDKDQLVQWTHDLLRQEARFRMLPYRIFQEQERAVLMAGMRQEEVEGKRVYPDVFVRLVVTRADLEWRPAEQQSGTRIFNVRLDLYLVDRFSGAVLGGNWRSGSRQEEIVSEERQVDIPATFRLLTKETLIALCRDMRSVGSGTTRKWPIQERQSAGGVRIGIHGTSPAPGQTLEVMRPVKTIRDQSGQPLGEYSERVGIVKVQPGGQAMVLGERPGGINRGDYAVGRSGQDSPTTGVVGLKTARDASSTGTDDQSVWLLLSAMVHSDIQSVLPESDFPTLLDRRGKFVTGAFALGRGVEDSDTFAGARTVTVSSRMRTENVTERGFDVVGGIVADVSSSPEGRLTQGLRKTYTMSRSAKGQSIDDLMARNSGWVSASILEETATRIAQSIASIPP